MLTKIILYYLLFINSGTFLLFGIDKHLSKKNKERIPESTLVLLSALGGAACGLAAMYIFRHKTQKAKFFLLLPMLLVLHIAISILIIF